MRLLARERKLLACVELEADLPSAEIQQRTGLRQHSIRYSLKKLYDSGVIGYRRPIIDMNLLGFVHYTLLFSLSSENQKHKDELLSDLIDSKYVSWIIELGGDYRYWVSICAKHLLDVQRFLDDIATKYGNIFFDKTLAAQVSFSYFGRKYLAPSNAQASFQSFAITDNPEVIFDDEEEMLSALANVRYRSLSQLAATLGIPSSTFERKKRQLEEKGIIRGYFYWINASKIGMTPYSILIDAKGINPAFKKKLFGFARKHPNVVFFTEYLGDWDYELSIEVESSSDVTALTEQLYALFADEIKGLKIVPILNYLKFKSYPPLRNE